MTKPKAVIFDIDGTLADVEHRRHFVDGTNGKKDFNKFYEAMGDDTAYDDMFELMLMYRFRCFEIIICTGRPEKYRQITKTWLQEQRQRFDNLGPAMHWNPAYHKLLMRPDDRLFQPDYLIKQDMLNELKKDYDIKLAIDDRDQVVKMWRDNGIRCLQVAEGDF